MIKVFQYIGFLNDGGAETLIRDYALLMDKNKFDVKIVTVFPSDGTTANGRVLLENNIETLSLYDSKAFKYLRHLGAVWFDSYRLKCLIKKHKPDVIHIHLGNLYRFKKISNHLKGIKLYYTCHSVPQKMLGDEMPKENAAARYLIAHNGLQLIALHADMKKELDDMFGSNAVVINNGIDFQKYQSLTGEQKEKLRKEIGLAKEDFVVGHVGRFAPAKNHPLLIEVFAEILKRKSNAKLLLVGNGPLESQVRSKIHEMDLDDKVIILKNRTDVNKLMRLMNIFIFPSLHEGFGIVLLEAQVSDLRCVTSDSINDSSICSDKTIRVSLKEPASKWAEIALDGSVRNEHYGNLADFDLRKEIKKVEELYLK